jgi:hypothetical protein
MLYYNISDSVYFLYVWYRPSKPRLQQSLSKTSNIPPFHRSSSILPLDNPPFSNSPPLLPPILQRLRKLTPLPNRRPLPIENITRKRNNQRQDRKISRRPLEFIRRTNVFIERRGIHSCYTGEEVACESVAAGGGGRVETVGGDHVVDCCHVDCEVARSLLGRRRGVVLSRGCCGLGRDSSMRSRIGRLFRVALSIEASTASLRVEGHLGLCVVSGFVCRSRGERRGMQSDSRPGEG